MGEFALVLFICFILYIATSRGARTFAHIPPHIVLYHNLAPSSPVPSRPFPSLPCVPPHWLPTSLPSFASPPLSIQLPIHAYTTSTTTPLYLPPPHSSLRVASRPLPSSPALTPCIHSPATTLYKWCTPLTPTRLPMPRPSSILHLLSSRPVLPPNPCIHLPAHTLPYPSPFHAMPCHLLSCPLVLSANPPLTC